MMTTLDKSFGDRVSDTSSSMSEIDSSSSDDFYGRKIIVQIHKREDLVQGTWINNQEVKCEQGKEWIEELELENLTHNTPPMKRLASALTDENLLSGDQSADSEQEEVHFIF